MRKSAWCTEACCSVPPKMHLLRPVGVPRSCVWQPDFKVIKKRIEDLIAREYLERDKENPNNFRYLA